MQRIFDVPLKAGTRLSCLKYDIALYCQTIEEVLTVVAPEYLKSYTKQIRTLSKKTASYRPTEFPDCTRTYIFDCRLRTLFAMLDVTKLTTSVMYSYGQEAFEPSDYVFGDAPPPCGIIDEGESLELFVKDFQFIPNDFFAFNHLAFFYQDRFISMTHLSTYQTAILLDRYKRQNLVDFKRLAEREVQQYRDRLPKRPNRK